MNKEKYIKFYHSFTKGFRTKKLICFVKQSLWNRLGRDCFSRNMKNNLIKSYLLIFLTLSSFSIYSEKTSTDILGDEIKNLPPILTFNYLYEHSFACYAWHQAILSSGNLTAEQEETQLDQIDFFNRKMLRLQGGEKEGFSAVLNDIVDRAPQSTKLYKDLITEDYAQKENLLRLTQESCDIFREMYPISEKK